MKLQKFIQQLINKIINIVFLLCITIVAWFTVQIFVIASFKIPSDSMEPELITGDNILVWKPTIGARIFNVFASMRNEQTDIYRIPGIRKIKRNDILVFNFPHPNSWDKIEMHILKYYIKRCIGLPGDTLFVENGIYRVNGLQGILGNLDSQKTIALMSDFNESIYETFPSDSTIGWNIKDFGPFYIPRAGDSIPLNRTNILLYQKIIEWEQLYKLEYRDSLVHLHNKPIEGYRFRKNYYFMAGDNGMNSQDSRYWGLLPEEYIVGKAWIIWKSIDPYTDKFRWDRFLKIIR